MKHIGEVHGIYTITNVSTERDKYGSLLYECTCNNCGYVRYAKYRHITGKRKTTKCRHVARNNNIRSYSHKWSNKRLCNIFRDMLNRCYSPRVKDYKWYGGKGIRVCDDWINNPKSFEDWALSNGYTDDLTIDRKNSNMDYTPENCCWISLKENSRRAGKVNWITVGEKTLTGRQWAKEIGVGTNTINKYIRKYGLDKTIEYIEHHI